MGCGGRRRRAGAGAPKPKTASQMLCGLIWKVLVSCVFLGIGVGLVLEYWNEWDEFMFWLGLGLSIAGGIIAIYFFVDVGKVLMLACSRTDAGLPTQTTAMTTIPRPTQQQQPRPQAYPPPSQPYQQSYQQPYQQPWERQQQQQQQQVAIGRPVKPSAPVYKYNPPGPSTSAWNK
mmetsp:Transcript_9163/g.22665  ORF Transcript_9163/g.22665 Transcript_9163/m.22665 type:complete len:175 (-) Transcript_9163:1181-1705(-)